MNLQRTLLLCGTSAAFAVMLLSCSGGQGPAPGAPHTSYMKISPTSEILTSELSGRVSAFVVSDVRPQVSGILKTRLFEEGSEVTAGQPLYQIDPALYQAAYDNAKANLMRAEANLTASRLLAQRYREIVGAKAVSKQEYDNAVAAYGQAKAETAAAKAAVESAAINLGYTKITAPESGRIGRSTVTPGTLVTQNQPQALATIQRLDTVYVDVNQSSPDLLHLKKSIADGTLKSDDGDSLKVRLKIESDTPYALLADMAEAAKDPFNTNGKWIIGKLLLSDVTISPTTGAITLRAVFDNPERVLLPNMYVRAIVTEGVRDNVFLLPQKIVSRNPMGRPVAFVLTKNLPAKSDVETPPLKENEYIAEERVLTVDRTKGDQYVITAGLAAGDLVVTNGLIDVRHGVRVISTEEGAQAPEAAAGTAQGR